MVVSSASGCRNELVWQRVSDEGGTGGLNALVGTVSQVSTRALVVMPHRVNEPTEISMGRVCFADRLKYQ